MKKRLGLIASNSFNQAIGIISALLLALVGARLLSVAEYGELRYAMTLLPLLMALSLPGLNPVTLRNTGLQAAVPLDRIFLTRLLTGCQGSLLIVAVLLIYVDTISDTLYFLLVATAVLLPLFETTNGYHTYLLGRGLAAAGTRLQLYARLGGLALFLVLIGLIYSLDIHALWIYPAWMVSTIIPTLMVSMRILIRRTQIGFQRRRFFGHIPIGQGVTATLAGLTYTLAYALDKLAIRFDMGAEALALYSILVMIPLELAKLVDSNILVFYRDLFFPRGKIHPFSISRSITPIVLLLIIYVFAFHWLSALIFGPAYQYPIFMVALSSLLFIGQSLEYFFIHKTLAISGAHVMFGYSLCNLCVTAAAVWGGLAIGGLPGLIIGLFFKQLIMLFTFKIFLKKPVHGL